MYGILLEPRWAKEPSAPYLLEDLGNGLMVDVTVQIIILQLVAWLQYQTWWIMAYRDLTINKDASICGCGGLNSLKLLAAKFFHSFEYGVPQSKPSLQTLWGWESCHTLLQSLYFDVTTMPIWVAFWVDWTTRFEQQLASHSVASTSGLSSSSLVSWILYVSLRQNNEAMMTPSINLWIILCTWIREVKHWILSAR